MPSICVQYYSTINMNEKLLAQGATAIAAVCIPLGNFQNPDPIFEVKSEAKEVGYVKDMDDEIAKSGSL